MRALTFRTSLSWHATAIAGLVSSDLPLGPNLLTEVRVSLDSGQLLSSISKFPDPERLLDDPSSLPGDTYPRNAENSLVGHGCNTLG